ncbi:hypothetical protein [Microseira wollei]|uniref:hypothetical protein n=1 Tax=Microseira wollei TaxID=467598 RepID=UPI001CFD7290|nr:hypothetical protein [Microseira wollei]
MLGGIECDSLLSQLWLIKRTVGWIKAIAFPESGDNVRSLLNQQITIRPKQSYVL